MLFVAALLHGVVILGVTFTSGTNGGSADATSVEVVLLTREYEKRTENQDAAYIAQQNLAGTGNTNADDELRVAYGRNADPIMPGLEREGTNTPGQTSTRAATDQQFLYARTRGGGTMSTRNRRASTDQAQQRTGMPGTANTIEILAIPDTDTVLQGAKPRELVISANTRESRIAAYLDSWKRRVERVGTSNFPYELLSQPAIDNPTLEVVIADNGKLTDVIIRSSSGSMELDMAAVEILKRAAPFDKFPEYLRNDYDALRFSYEWRFGSRSVESMRVP